MLSSAFPLRSIALGVLGLTAIARSAVGQGLIVDHRPNVPIAQSFDVREVVVDARIRDQVAEVQVSQTFHNPGSFDLETEYLFPMPEEGAIQNFVLMVDGRELPGEIMAKEDATRIFEAIVRSKKDPALLEYMGRGLIKTRVFPIPAGADRKVTLRYTKLLPRDREVVEFSYPFATQKFTTKPIERLAMTARIESTEPIKSIYSPTDDVEVDRDGDHRATVKLVNHDVVPQSDFRAIYTLADGKVGASVLSYRPSDGEDGYFLLLASPQVEHQDDTDRPKTVVFVLDRSGSMQGDKIKQARGALKYVLNNLREGDTFNIIAYDDRVEAYKPELQRSSRESREDAIRFVENLFPGGSTNIDGALTAALEMIRDDSRPAYVLFLTDGLPTAGEQSEPKIADHAKMANGSDARIFAFGVGYDVNARLLDRLSGGNGGTSEYVTPDEDIEADVARFYDKLTSPVLTDIQLEIDGTDVNRVYPRDLPDLFEGGQLVVVGRYRHSGPTDFRLVGRVGEDRQTVRFDAHLARPGVGSGHQYVETLWAVRRVGFLIDQIDLHGASGELTGELVDLSKRYGILTPYTAFLADENVNLQARGDQVRRAGEQLDQLAQVQGAVGVGQRELKAGYMAAQRPASADSAGQPLATARAEMARQVNGYRSQMQQRVNAMRGRGNSGGLGGGGLGGGGLGGGGMNGSDYEEYGKVGAEPAAGPAPAAGAKLAVGRDAEGRPYVAGGVRRMGGKTFYRRGDRWVDSALTPELEKAAETIEQFSDAYFELARGQTAERNQFLTFEEPVTVVLGAKAYRIERPTGR